MISILQKLHCAKCIVSNELHCVKCIVSNRSNCSVVLNGSKFRERTCTLLVKSDFNHFVENKIRLNQTKSAVISESKCACIPNVPKNNKSISEKALRLEVLGYGE